MTRPLYPFQISRGGTYWAAMGDTKWSAIEVTKVQRKWAFAKRVKPSTGAVTTKKAKVKLSELVARNPALKGKDKPTDPPSVVFAALRGEGGRNSTAPQQPAQVTTPTTAPSPKTASDAADEMVETTVDILSLIDDDSTDDDW